MHIFTSVNKTSSRKFFSVNNVTGPFGSYNARIHGKLTNNNKKVAVESVFIE